jgi:hypothetical protein
MDEGRDAQATKAPEKGDLDKEALPEKWLTKLKNTRTIAALVVVSTIIVGLSTLITGVITIFDTFAPKNDFLSFAPRRFMVLHSGLFNPFGEDAALVIVQMHYVNNSTDNLIIQKEFLTLNFGQRKKVLIASQIADYSMGLPWVRPERPLSLNLSEYPSPLIIAPRASLQHEVLFQPRDVDIGCTKSDRSYSWKEFLKNLREGGDVLIQVSITAQVYGGGPLVSNCALTLSAMDQQHLLENGWCYPVCREEQKSDGPV